MFFCFVFCGEFFQNNFLSLISVLLLEGIYFYNFTTPEFNVNVCQLPFWTLSVLYGWKGFKNNKTIDWLLFGFIAGVTAPSGKRMGHAGAIISRGIGGAKDKIKKMEECGITIAQSPSEIGKTLLNKLSN